MAESPVTPTPDRQREGWFWPDNARKAHYYGEDNRSLCGKWFVLVIREYAADAAAPPSPDDCAACSRKLAARVSEGAS